MLASRYIWTRTAARVPPKLANLSVWNVASVSTLMHFSPSPLFHSNRFRCLILDRSLQHVRWCAIASHWSGEHSRTKLAVGLLYRAFDQIRSWSQMRSVQIFQGEEPVASATGLSVQQEVANRCRCVQVGEAQLQSARRAQQHGLLNTLTHPTLPRLHRLHKRLWHL